MFLFVWLDWFFFLFYCSIFATLKIYEGVKNKKNNQDFLDCFVFLSHSFDAGFSCYSPFVIISVN